MLLLVSYAGFFTFPFWAPSTRETWMYWRQSSTMVQGLEHLILKEGLRELRLFILEKNRLRGILSVCTSTCRRMQRGWSLALSSGAQWQDQPEHQETPFHLESDWAPSQVAQRSGDTCTCRHSKASGHGPQQWVLGGPAWEEGVGPCNHQRSLPTSAILYEHRLRRRSLAQVWVLKLRSLDSHATLSIHSKLLHWADGLLVWQIECMKRIFNFPNTFLYLGKTQVCELPIQTWSWKGHHCWRWHVQAIYPCCMISDPGIATACPAG